MPSVHSPLALLHAISHAFPISRSVFCSCPTGTSENSSVFLMVVRLSVENETGATTVESVSVGAGVDLEASNRWRREVCA